ncbi:MAG: hypothetical protein M0R68_13205 [Bacteroidetes bacterium]|nr:hypothetical protein [Bacteroidota bacterium]
MKKILFLLFFSSSYILAQSASDTPTLTSWRGGIVNFQAGIGLNMLGVGTASATAGGVLSPRLNNGAASIFYNPAELITLRRPHVIIDSRLGVGTDLFGIEGNTLLSDQTLSQQTDDFLKDTSIFIYDKKNGFKLPSKVKNGSAGLLGQFTSFSVGIPIARGLVLGFGSYYPMDLSLGFRVSDVSMKLRATRETGTQTIGIDILLNMAVSTNLLIRSNVMNIGLGYELMNNRFGQLSIGVTGKRYDVRTVLDLDLPIDGLIAIQKSEYYFNDPLDRAIDFEAGETNALKWKAHGDYRDTRWGGTFGIYYNAVRYIDTAIAALNLSVLYEYAPSFTMDDPLANSKSYAPVFLVGKPGGTGADSMQILIDSLRLSKPSLTKETHNVFSNTLTVSQASSLTLGMDLGFGAHTIALNYVHYFGEYGFIFDRYHVTKKLTSGIKVGLDFTLPNRMTGWNWLLLPVRLLYLDVDGLLFQAFQSSTGYRNSHYRLGGGVVLGSADAHGMDPDMAKSLRTSLGTVLPTGFALGRQYTIFARYTVGVLVFGIPDIAFKTSLGIVI